VPKQIREALDALLSLDGRRAEAILLEVLAGLREGS